MTEQVITQKNELEVLQQILQKLKQLREQRIQEAREKDIAGKAMLVATHFGKTIYKKHGAYNNWEAGGGVVSVSYDDYGPNVYISYKGKRVFTYHLGKIESYVPGDWEQVLEAKYREAEQIEKQKEQELLQRKIAELQERWGVVE